MTKHFVWAATLIVVVAMILAHLGEPGPQWACNAEDEVVVIDNTCRHIDTLKGE